MTPLLCLVLLAAPAPGVEVRVHAAIRESMAANGGRALFSTLDNAGTLSPAERDYAARLYELFFALPAQIAAEQRAQGRPPRLAELAAGSGLGLDAVDLLLDVATGDPRMPALIERGSPDGEIASVDLAAIDAFVVQKGSSVKVAGWTGKPLPAFDLPRVGGGRLDQNAISGRPALVFLWLTRCPVCRRFTPEVVALQKKYEPRGLRVIGLNADEALHLEVPAAEREAWLKEQGVPYANAVLDEATRAALGNQNIFPGFFLVRGDGTVERLVLHPPDRTFLANLIEPLLGGKEEK